MGPVRGVMCPWDPKYWQFFFFGGGGGWALPRQQGFRAGESTEVKTEETTAASESVNVESKTASATEALQSPGTAPAPTEASAGVKPDKSSSEADPSPKTAKGSSTPEPETLIFRPGASWGTPTLDKAGTRLDTSVASTTVKQNGCPSPRSEELSPAEEESPAAVTTPAIDYSVVDPCPPHPSGRRVYAFDFLLSVATVSCRSFAAKCYRVWVSSQEEVSSLRSTQRVA